MTPERKAAYKFEIYYAGVLLREAAARRSSAGGFHAILLNGARNARLRAAELCKVEQPAQGELAI